MNAFDQLPLSEKIKMIKLAGEHIASISHLDYTICLYLLDNFLVEKYLDSQTKKIVKIQSTEYLQLLKYIPHINITSLYKFIS